MKRSLLRIAAVCFILVSVAPPSVTAQTQPSGQEFLSYRLFVYVLAPDREALSVDLANWADGNDGYFVERSGDQVVLRTPRSTIPALRAYIESKDGVVLRFEPATADLRQELLNTRAAVSSRQESLDRILELIGSADIGATLAFEQELRSLNQEIEYYRGIERLILNDSRYAHVRIALTSEQSSIPDYLPSAFSWINTIDLYQFLKDRS